MKKVLFLIPAILMMIALIAINAQAMSPIREATYLARLDRTVKIEQRSSFAFLPSIARADVELVFDMYDKRKNTITVTAVAPQYRCSPNQRCMGPALAPVTVQVPYTSRQVDACGSVLYTGKKDLRPADGLYTEIQVVDNRKNNCPHFVAQPATEVLVIEKGNSRGMMPALWEASAQFTGSALELQPQYHE
jgi:hypothetical protein